MNKILRLYLLVFLLGRLTNMVLIIMSIKVLGFDYKSELSVYIYSIPGYFLKSLFFSTSLFLLLKKSNLENRLKRNVVLWIPFTLLSIWFITIISFKIEALHTELSYGYISRFPHFIIQLLASLIITIASIFHIRKITHSSQNPSELIMFKIVIISVLLIGTCYYSLFLLKKQKAESFCNKYATFNSVKWKADKKVRYCMLDDIISKKILINKTKAEITTLLGEPFTSNNYFNNIALQFRTTQKNGQYQHWYLFVELENGIVTRVQKSLD